MWGWTGWHWSSFPAQSLPFLSPEVPGPCCSRRNLARPPCNTNSPVPFAFLIQTVTDQGGEDGWKGPDTGPKGGKHWQLALHRDGGGHPHPLSRQFCKEALMGGARQGRDNTASSMRSWDSAHQSHPQRGHSYQGRVSNPAPLHRNLTPNCTWESPAHLQGFEAPATLLQSHPGGNWSPFSRVSPEYQQLLKSPWLILVWSPVDSHVLHLKRITWGCWLKLEFPGSSPRDLDWLLQGYKAQESVFLSSSPKILTIRHIWKTLSCLLKS